ncbi:hypothetical protein [Spirosoma sordidisoli]|uniref:Uncharacterized protein n=1 Tax=Spirosoma sordidisoli TaxID=2502893 RepID=A0A4Q2UMK9_9BACT|nr:hypothetical protein [Spirosoma sordidisoli]RYC70012.1 hypothetical protein EQG79_09075 [Spirosoma sordidisoli]
MCTGQQLTLDSIATYEESYRYYMQQRWKADRKEFTAVSRNKWWYYLPTAGYNLRSPLVHLNTGVLAQIDHDRVTRGARLESIDARYQVEFTETLGRIRAEHRKLQVRKDQLQRDRKLLDKLNRIRQIHDEAHRSQTMTPEEYIRNVYQHEAAISLWEAKQADWEVALLEFWNLCRYQMPASRLVEIADADCPVVTDHDTAGTFTTVVTELPRPKESAGSSSRRQP